MIKRLMAIAVMVCAMPAMALATSWTLNTQVSTPGGTMASRNKAAQTSTSPSLFGTYTTHTMAPITVASNSGYTISSFTVNNVAVAGCAAGSTNCATASLTGAVAQTVAVKFAAAVFNETATATTGGTVTPASYSNIYYGAQSPGQIFTFTPTSGFALNSITPTNATIQCSTTPFTVYGACAAPYAAGAAVKVKVTNVTGNVTVAGSFSGPPVANAGANQFAVVSTKVSLSGSATNGTAPYTYAWTQTAGTAVTLSNPSVANPTFTAPAAAGALSFKLTVTDSASMQGTSSMQVTVTTSAASAAYNSCTFCHIQNGIGGPNNLSAAQMYSNWSSSIHSRSTHSICSGCHIGTNSGGHPGDVNSATVNPTTFVTNVALPNEGLAAGVVYCTACHTGAYPIPHPTTGLDATQACLNCHYTTGLTKLDAHALNASNVNATLDNCTNCHTGTGIQPSDVNGTCASCHTSSTVHLFQAVASADCVGCHNVAIQHPGNFVSDNTGVRAITGANGEFEAATSKLNASGYRSHHIYNGAGVDPQNAQCIACHLEGKVGKNRTVVLDPTYHMADNKVHLRSGNTAISANFAWDPANPDHTGMDNFCMSCHNAAGAITAYQNMSSALKGMTAIVGATPPSPKNPFGDLLKNAYDGLTRPQVVAVYEQFDTGNVSHHAVRGQKYTGRTRATSSYPANFTQYSGATQGNVLFRAAAPTTPVQVQQYYGNYSTGGPAAGFGPNFSGSRQTLYEANLFVASYTTLNGAVIGDDSTLHCGDCHTNGQWKNGSANAVVFNNMSNAQFGQTIQPTTAVIGAHGSKNEYMLRTSNGSDALHTQGATAKSSGVAPNVVYRASSNGTYVCYLCHKQEAYGDNNYFRTDAGIGVTSFRDHAGVHYNNGCDSSAQQSVGKVGYANRVNPLNLGSPKLGTVFGYTCSHCHSSGNQLFGGIHGNALADGSAKNVVFLTYSTDGTDIIGKTLAGGYASRSYNTEHDTLNFVQRLPYRFMGGTGLRYNGGVTASKWEAKTLSGNHREGCYNLSATSATTNLWNTTNPKQSLSGGPGGNAILNSNGNDSAWGANDYSVRLAQNDGNGAGTGTSGWGACNHHQGSTTGGATAPTRSVQRPLVY